MKISKCILRAIFILLLSARVDATEKVLEVVVGLAKPPYVYPDKKSGFELNLVSHVINQMGYELNFTLVPYGRGTKMLAVNGIDAVMTVNNRSIPDESVLSSSYITYQNVAISLKNRNIRIETIDDLSNYSVSAFQFAHVVLGETFSNAMLSSPLYVQTLRQDKQVELLFLSRVDVIVMDINIFNYYKSIHQSSEIHDVDIHYIFPKNRYKMAFKDQTLIPKFNKALKEVKQSGYYNQLLKKYNLIQ